MTRPVGGRRVTSRASDIFGITFPRMIRPHGFATETPDTNYGTMHESLDPQRKRDLRALSLASALFSAICLCLSLGVSKLPLFDTSPTIAFSEQVYQASLRWDVLHFENIASHGRVFEHEWAFLPGAPFLIWLGKRISLAFTQSEDWASLLLLPILLVAVLDATRIIYQLTLHIMKSHRVAWLVGLLSIISSSPATLRLAPYAEALFVCLSYRGTNTGCICMLSHSMARFVRYVSLCKTRVVACYGVFLPCYVFPLERHRI